MSVSSLLCFWWFWISSSQICYRVFISAAIFLFSKNSSAALNVRVSWTLVLTWRPLIPTSRWLEINMAISHKHTSPVTTQFFYSFVQLNNVSIRPHKDCTRMSTAGFFVIAKNCPQPKGPPREWINQVCYIPTVFYYSTPEGWHTCTKTWSPTHYAESTCCEFPFVWTYQWWLKWEQFSWAGESAGNQLTRLMGMFDTWRQVRVTQVSTFVKTLQSALLRSVCFIECKIHLRKRKKLVGSTVPLGRICFLWSSPWVSWLGCFPGDQNAGSSPLERSDSLKWPPTSCLLGRKPGCRFSAVARRKIRDLNNLYVPAFGEVPWPEVFLVPPVQRGHPLAFVMH